MGRTATCAVDVTPAPKAATVTHASVAVLLETDEIVLRLTPRTIVPRADVTSPTVDGDALVFGHGRAVYRLELGSKEAARWAHDLLHPKTLIDKLGVVPGASVAAIGVEDGAFLDDLAARLGRAPATKLGRDHTIVFFATPTRASLAELPRVKKSLGASGAIWILRPKGKAAPKEAPTEAEVRAACGALDLVDVKVARFSDALTAEKYAQRRKS